MTNSLLKVNILHFYDLLQDLCFGREKKTKQNKPVMVQSQRVQTHRVETQVVFKCVSFHLDLEI